MQRVTAGSVTIDPFDLLDVAGLQLRTKHAMKGIVITYCNLLR